MSGYESATDERLRFLVEYARRETSYYATLIADRIAGSGIGALKSVPPLGRLELQENLRALVANGVDLARAERLTTSGTTGAPVSVVMDPIALGTDLACFGRAVDSVVREPSWRDRDVLHVQLHPSSSHTRTAPWSAKGRIIKWCMTNAWQANDEVFVNVLRQFDANVVTTMPSVAELLATRYLMYRGQTGLTPACIVLSGESVTERARQVVTDAFRCPVTSLYALTEAGIVGVECSTAQGYHVEQDTAYVEIVDENDEDVAPGQVGQVLVTPLANLAMPILRYRTGDRARWISGACGCGIDARRFEVLRGRTPQWLRTPAGYLSNVVRFSKLLASFSIDRYEISQSQETGMVEIGWASRRQLERASEQLLIDMVRAALGPGTAVSFHCIPRAHEANGRAEEMGSRLPDPRIVESSCVNPRSMGQWLQGRLSSILNLEAAVLTGSSLNPSVATRESDVDLVLLVRDDARETRWRELARELRRQSPRLSVNVDSLHALSNRAPLVACRLRLEQYVVSGRIDEDNLPFPSIDALMRESTYFLHTSAASVFGLSTDPCLVRMDIVRVARIASKVALNAIRYFVLIRNHRVTEAGSLVALAQLRYADRWPWFSTFRDAFDTAREHKPPPVGTEVAIGYLDAAAACIASVGSSCTEGRTLIE